MTNRDYCTEEERCSSYQPIEERPLMSLGEATRLADTFKVLSGETRLMLLHALAREGELAVGRMVELLGMKPQAVSNQLHKLLDLGIVNCRRDGNQMIYRIVDWCVIVLLDRGMCLNESSAALQSPAETSIAS